MDPVQRYPSIIKWRWGPLEVTNQASGLDQTEKATVEVELDPPVSISSKNKYGILSKIAHTHASFKTRKSLFGLEGGQD